MPSELINSATYIPLTEDQLPSATLRKASKITVRFDDRRESAFHCVWLRDHCKCAECWHPKTHQRFADITQMPLNVTAGRMRVSEDRKELIVTWLHDGHESPYSFEWLRHNTYDPPLCEDFDLKPQRLWRASDLEREMPTVQYEAVMADDEALKAWLLNIETYGISFIDGIPSTPEATDALVRRIAFVRETHYGLTHVIANDMAHGDAAFSGAHLPAHADTCYFTDSVGLLLMHILYHNNGTGGESTFVDGFAVAEHLKHHHRWAYDALTSVGVSYHSAGDASTHISPLRASPILQAHPAHPDRLLQVRHNNEDRSVLRGVEGDVMAVFYAALQLWTRLLKEDEWQVRIKMPRGRAAIVDNWRVLHGRTAFTGSRALCAAYVNRDDWRSRVRMVVDGNREKQFI
ncbi:uncharacterized protein EV422DRAFT_56770 [Fimicolochytrium jonesii]|uniref:uncharacterized protein n=1 Tax=Fimicolochytrium jonesii TaxID=1396493 RepID=UPI0022FDD8A9|nr:uncharacterized protein EV422DRAFT_56770 [Fimicolochytrium jonesii]KAI8821176.1 hypothetical protein EV422DRAFT_56770 [Fimicolochytrium jonesii]